MILEAGQLGQQVAASGIEPLPWVRTGSPHVSPDRGSRRLVGSLEEASQEGVFVGSMTFCESQRYERGRSYAEESRRTGQHGAALPQPSQASVTPHDPEHAPQHAVSLLLQPPKDQD